MWLKFPLSSNIWPSNCGGDFSNVHLEGTFWSDEVAFMFKKTRIKLLNYYTVFLVFLTNFIMCCGVSLLFL